MAIKSLRKAFTDLIPCYKAENSITHEEDDEIRGSGDRRVMTCEFKDEDHRAQDSRSEKLQLQAYMQREACSKLFTKRFWYLFDL